MTSVRFAPGAALFLSAHIALAGAVSEPRLAVTNPDNVHEIMNAAATRPVDFIFTGDSTVYTGFGGKFRALREVLLERGYQEFATELLSVSEGNDGGGGDANFAGWTPTNAPAAYISSGAHPAIEPSMHLSADAPPNVIPGHSKRYAHISTANPQPPSTGMGAHLDVNARLDRRGAISFNIWWGEGATPGGSFCPEIRYNFDGMGSYLSLSGPLPAVPTLAPGTPGVRHWSYTLPANSSRPLNRSIVLGMGNIAAGQWVNPPFTALYTRAWNPERTHGFSCSVLDHKGGESDYGMAVRLRDWALFDPVEPSKSLSLYLSILIERQQAMGAEPLLVFIYDGFGNSWAETGVSLDGVHTNVSPEGALANWIVWKDLIERTATLNGWPLGWFRFITRGFTPVGGSPAYQNQEAVFDSYRTAVAAHIRDELDPFRHSFVDWAVITSYEEAQASGWWRGGFDQAHWTVEAYTELTRRMVAKAARQVEVDADTP